MIDSIELVVHSLSRILILTYFSDKPILFQNRTWETAKKGQTFPKH